jgi:hypothetical protein
VRARTSSLLIGKHMPINSAESVQVDDKMTRIDYDKCDEVMLA